MSDTAAGAVTAAAPRTATVGVAAGIVAMVAWAASGVISKGLDMGSMAIVLYRMWLYSATMVVALSLTRGHRLTAAKLWTATPGGIALGLDIALFFTAVKETTVANATVIGALQPLLLLWAGPKLFGQSERTGRREVALALVAIAGVAIVLFGSTGLPDWKPRGDLLAAGSLVVWTWYFVCSKRTQGTMRPLEYTACTAIVATLVNTPIALLSGQDLSMPSAGNWVWLVLLALGPGLVGHGLMNWSLTRIPMWLGATLGLFVPVTATLLAWLFIDEQVEALQFGGMGLVLVALMALVLRPSTAIDHPPVASATPSVPPTAGAEASA